MASTETLVTRASVMADTFGFPQPDPYDGAIWKITAGFMALCMIIGAWHGIAELGVVGLQGLIR